MFVRGKMRWMTRILALAIILTPAGLWAQKKADTSKGKDKDQVKFEVYQDSAKDYRWRLVSGEDKDRQVLATGGQGYKAKADCMHGLKSIQEGSDKLKFETYEDNAKQNRWRAKASNGQVMASSASSYKTKAECDSAVETIKRLAPKATVDEAAQDKS